MSRNFRQSQKFIKKFSIKRIVPSAEAYFCDLTPGMLSLILAKRDQSTKLRTQNLVPHLKYNFFRYEKYGKYIFL